MQTFRIFIDNKGNIEPVKTGWSWPASIFPLIWAAIKGLWLVLAVTIALLISVLYLLTVIAQTPQIIELTVILGMLATNVVFGFYGNSWIEKKLSAKNFQFAGAMSASSSEQAVHTFAERTNPR